jgi:hypothetical protein
MKRPIVVAALCTLVVYPCVPHEAIALQAPPALEQYLRRVPPAVMLHDPTAHSPTGADGGSLHSGA